jgi:hypothetical protein
MEATMQLVVEPSGQIRCLYTETILLTTLGSLVITRASHVEPEAAGWYTDLARSGGPKLGPFVHRSEALQAEEAWLEERLPVLAFLPDPAGGQQSVG